MGFPGGSAGKESACNTGDLGLIPGLGRTPGEGKGYPLQCSGLENSMNSPWGHKESDTTEPLSLSDSILKSKQCCTYKIHLVKAMVFPVLMYGCETWTIKKAEH